ncbi:MAG: transposase [Oligoflexia bacterium]|nr:transposase [Oligoflexia bacterium]
MEQFVHRLDEVHSGAGANGKVECFNGNLAKELFNVQHCYDVGEMKRRLASHLHLFNHRRTHHSLGGLLVPADRYYAETLVMRSLGWEPLEAIGWWKETDQSIVHYSP